MTSKPRPGKMPPGSGSKYVPGQGPLQSRLAASKTRPNTTSNTPAPGESAASKLNERRKAAARQVDGAQRPIGRPKKNAGEGTASPNGSPTLAKVRTWDF